MLHLAFFVSYIATYYMPPTSNKHDFLTFVIPSWLFVWLSPDNCEFLLVKDGHCHLECLHLQVAACSNTPSLCSADEVEHVSKSTEWGGPQEKNVEKFSQNNRGKNKNHLKNLINLSMKMRKCRLTVYKCIKFTWHYEMLW